MAEKSTSGGFSGGDLYGYYYNAVASLSTALGGGEARLSDSAEAWVLGRRVAPASAPALQVPTATTSSAGETVVSSQQTLSTGSSGSAAGFGGGAKPTSPPAAAAAAAPLSPRGGSVHQRVTDHFAGVSYFTYRKGIATPLSNGATHDAGWGCMVRTGQMMLCEALKRAFRGHRPTMIEAPGTAAVPSSPSSPLASSKNAGAGSAAPATAGAAAATSSGATNSGKGSAGNPSKIGGKTSSAFAPPPTSAPAPPPPMPEAEWLAALRSWFMDVPEAPFGLHAFAAEGARIAGIPVGTWFTPSALCRCVASLVERTPEVAARLAVVAALDQLVPLPAMRDILEPPRAAQPPAAAAAAVGLLDDDDDLLAPSPPPPAAASAGRAVLLLVPLMLGMTSLGKQYEPVVKRCLQLPATVGIVGGRPKMSLYFVGHQEQQLFYLDPHVVQTAFTSRATLGSASGPRGTAALSSIDPCMLLAFCFTSRGELDEWERSIVEVNAMPEFPILTLQRARPAAGPGGAPGLGAFGSAGYSAGFGGAAAAAAGATAAGATATASRAAPDPLVDDCEFDEDL